MITLRLGLRFAFAGGHQGRTRSLLVISANALGVLLMLGVLALWSLQFRQAQRESHLRPRYGVGHTAPDTLFVQQRDFFTWDRENTVITDIARGRGHLLPPGVTALPAPGELVVSPRLDELLRRNADLRSILPGRVVGTIDLAGLVRPAQLFVYRGVEARPDMPTATSFGRQGEGYHGFLFGGGEQLPDAGKITLVVLTFLALPLLVLTASAARLSSSTRDRRLAALRLMGVTARRTRQIAAVEAAGLGVIGAGIGGLAFVALRPVTEQVRFADFSAFAEDLLPRWWQTTFALAAMPGVSMLVVLAPTWRLSWFPLRARRTAGDDTPAIARLLPLLSGLALLGFVLIGKTPHIGNDDGLFHSASFWSGAGCVALGITLLVPFALRSGAVPMRSQSSRPGLRRVARPLLVPRTNASRLAAALGLFVMLLGLALLAADFAGGYLSDDDLLLGPLMIAAAVLTSIGLLLAVPWALQVSAARVARRTPRTWLRIAARRLEAEPSTTTRVIAGLVIAVFACAGAQSALVWFDRSPAHQFAIRSMDPEAPQNIMMVDSPEERVDVAALRATPGVTTAVHIRELRSIPCGSHPRGELCIHALVATCAELAVLRPDILGCREGVSGWISKRWTDASERTFETYQITATNTGVRPRVRVPLPDTVLLTQAQAPRSQFRDGRYATVDLLLAPHPRYERTFAGQPHRYQVNFRGGLNTLGRINAQAPNVQVQSQSVHAYFLGTVLASTKYHVILWSVTVLGLLVGFAALAVTGIDYAGERRRKTATLQALGTPAAVLRRGQFVQVFAPAALGVLLASGLGLAAGATYLSVYDYAAYTPFRQVGLVLLGGLVAAALTALAPMRAASQPLRADDLRRE